MILAMIWYGWPKYRKLVIASIAAKIGVLYKIVIIDNSTHKCGICAVHNEGAACSKHELLCFAREDLMFNTPD